MSGIPAIVTSQNVTFIFENKQYTIAASHPNFVKICQAIEDNKPEVLQDLACIGKAIEKYAAGSIQIEGGVIKYKDEPLHGYLVDKILYFMEKGHSYKPLVAFLEKLQANPSKRAVDELYKFLDSHGIPIDADGYFYGYKSIRPDWTDWHTGTIKNEIGMTVEMLRNKVDDNYEVGCSDGLHAGNLEYAESFHSGCGRRLVVVKINPADVVSVPKEDCRKLRCCKYQVVSLFKEELPSDLYQPDEEPNDTEETDYDAGYDEGYEDGFAAGQDDAS